MSLMMLNILDFLHSIFCSLFLIKTERFIYFDPFTGQIITFFNPHDRQNI